MNSVKRNQRGLLHSCWTGIRLVEDSKNYQARSTLELTVSEQNSSDMGAGIAIVGAR